MLQVLLSQLLLLVFEIIPKNQNGKFLTNPITQFFDNKPYLGLDTLLRFCIKKLNKKSLTIFEIMIITVIFLLDAT